MASLEKLQESVKKYLAPNIKASHQHVGELTIEVAPEELHTVCEKLLTKDGLLFEQLIDITAVDYLCYKKDEWTTDSATSTGFGRGREQDDDPELGMPERYGVIYHLLSVTNNQRIRVKSKLSGNNPMISSVTDIWSSADWFERECFDMFGILFSGHPDLRRILTDYGFIGHPLRKDFPTSGHVEVRYDPEQQRVVYQPVSIEPRVLVPKVIRDDHRYTQQAQTDEKGC